MRALVTRRALFLDRDGTLIEEREYLSDPDGVALLPGVAEAVRALQDAGFLPVIVTNQSGIGRGYYTEGRFRAVQRRLEALLAAEGVTIAATYHCPHDPVREAGCACRKPAPGLFLQAAAELGLDLADSVYVGDRVRDVLPGVALGGRAYLVATGYGREERRSAPAGVRLVHGLADVARAEGAPPLTPGSGDP